MQSLLLASNLYFTDRAIVIFGFAIYYYALVIVAGILAATTLSVLLLKRRNISTDLTYLIFLVCVPSAIIGARLFSCLTDSNLGITKFFQFRDGGMSITGAIIGGVLSGFILSLVKKINFFRATDCIVINFLVGQAIGRWGNFFNQEVYGGVVTNPNLQWFPFSVNIDGTWHYAFFFYEMMLNLLGWAILFSIAWFRKSKPNGILTCAYFVWYGAVRTVMEPLRDPEFILSKGGVPWSQLFSILMFGLGICAIMGLLIINYLREGKFVGSRRGDPCGITRYIPANKKDIPYYSKLNLMGANYPPRPPEEKKKKGKKGKDNAPPPDEPPKGGEAQ